MGDGFQYECESDSPENNDFVGDPAVSPVPEDERPSSPAHKKRKQVNGELVSNHVIQPTANGNVSQESTVLTTCTFVLYETVPPPVQEEEYVPVIQKEDFIEAMCFSIEDAIFLIINDDGVAVACNKYLLDLLGLQNTEAVQQDNWYDHFVSPADYTQACDDFARAVAGDFTPPMRTTHRIRSSTNTLIDWTTSRVSDEEGDFVASVVIGHIHSDTAEIIAEDRTESIAQQLEQILRNSP